MLAVPRRRLFSAVSAIVATIGAMPMLEAQRAPADKANITAAGCLAQLPDAAAAPPTGHEQTAAKGLMLARAMVKSTDGRAATVPSQSAVPGSLPAGRGSGTTDAAATRQAAAVEQSFWLVGTKSAELTRFIGKRVEVAGMVDERLSANPGTADAGAAAARRAATAPPEVPSTAHPSAPTRAISVLSFRMLDESCS